MCHRRLAAQVSLTRALRWIEHRLTDLDQPQQSINTPFTTKHSERKPHASLTREFAEVVAANTAATTSSRFSNDLPAFCRFVARTAIASMAACVVGSSSFALTRRTSVPLRLRTENSPAPDTSRAAMFLIARQFDHCYFIIKNAS